MLDIASGQWRTAALPTSAHPPSWTADGRFEPTGGGRLILLGFVDDGLLPTEPTSVFDPATATFRPPSAGDLDLWTELYTLGDATMQSLAD